MTAGWGGGGLLGRRAELGRVHGSLLWFEAVRVREVERLVFG